jgi:hypothetical protein
MKRKRQYPSDHTQVLVFGIFSNFIWL